MFRRISFTGSLTSPCLLRIRSSDPLRRGQVGRSPMSLIPLAFALVACDGSDPANPTDTITCDPQSAPIKATPEGDTTYTSWSTTACLGEKPELCAEPTPAILESLLRCEAVQGGWYWDFGESAFRVHGRKDDTCRIEWLIDVEGGARVLMCDIPLQLRPWPGLSQVAGGEVFDDPLLGIEEHCTETRRCSLIFGGPDECRTLTPEPPQCRRFMAGTNGG